MKNIKPLLGVLLVLFSTNFAPNAEARVGGGGSSGFRGSRGFSNSQRMAPRPSAPSNYGNNQQPQSPMGGGSPMMRGLMGGLAGSFIGSMLFRNMGHADNGMGSSGGGFGFLEFALLAAAGLFAFKLFSQRKTATASATNYYEAPIASASYTEQDNANILQRSDGSFDLTSFKEQRMDDFLKIQSAWNTRDLSSVTNIIAPDFQKILDSDIETLKKSQRINRLENIAVRSSDLVESWQEPGKEYATLKFKAQLLDFTIDENTQEVVDGNRNQPVKFEEEWTFVRNHSGMSGNNQWALTAISNS